MAQVLKSLPRAAIFLAGVAVGVLAGSRRNGRDSRVERDLKRSLADLERRLAAQEHAARLADGSSTGQIVAAMEQLLSETMSSLDTRLTAQANSIEMLKTTVSQTDHLLEQVLESLDSLQSDIEPGEDTLLQHPAV